jgi:hypothetical protein
VVTLDEVKELQQLAKESLFRMKYSLKKPVKRKYDIYRLVEDIQVIIYTNNYDFDKSEKLALDIIEVLDNSSENFRLHIKQKLNLHNFSDKYSLKVIEEIIECFTRYMEEKCGK